MNVTSRISNLLIEEKVIRRVRTPEGARWFGQPIGSIIVRDPPSLRRRRRIIELLTPPSDMQSLVKLEEEDLTKRQKALDRVRKEIGRTRNSGQYSDWVETKNHDGSTNMRSASEHDGVVTTVTYNEYEPGSSTLGHYRVESVDRQTGRRSNPQILHVYHDTDEASSEDRAFQLADEAYDEVIAKRPDVISDDKPVFWDTWEGMRGRDWSFEGDEDELPEWSDDEEDQTEILNAEMDRLGIDVFGQNERYPSTSTTAAIVSVMSVMEERLPGLSKIASRFSIDLDAESRIGGIAYNRLVDTEMKSFIRSGLAAQFGGGWRGVVDGANMDHFDVGADWGQTLIGLNPIYFAHDIDPVVMENRWEAALSNNPEWFSYNAQAIKDMTGMTWTELGQLTTVTHEIGHTLGFALFRTLNNKLGSVEEQDKRREAMRRIREIFERNGIKVRDEFEYIGRPQQMDKTSVDNKALARNLSQYGAYNIHEVFAESFASYMLNPKPSQLAVDIGELLEEAMREYLESLNDSGWKRLENE